MALFLIKSSIGSGTVVLRDQGLVGTDRACYVMHVDSHIFLK